MNMIHLLTFVLIFVFMETKLTNNVLTKYTPRGAIPNISNENFALKKNFIEKQLSLPTKVALLASSSKDI
uniref:Uncharacterized protein n=1 Tax=Meloidogyne enterolobii TaxID=390850 RepID=A0A6V7WNX9_MELEN|nr:unnamed protein product [Meloidogyne enterolobii]